MISLESPYGLSQHKGGHSGWFFQSQSASPVAFFLCPRLFFLIFKLFCFNIIFNATVILCISLFLLFKKKIKYGIVLLKCVIGLISNPSIKFYIYIQMVQVTLSVTLKSYTFFKPLDLSISNSQKMIIINANILIDLIYYLLFNIFYTYF